MRLAASFAAAAVLSLAAACGGNGASAVTVTIVSPSAGASFGGNVVLLDLEVSGVQIVPADGDTSGSTGHYHVFVDRPPVAAGEAIPREAGVIHSASEPVELTGLSVGEHELSVVLGDGTHSRIGDAVATVSVTVEGPSIDATAPATVAAGQSLVVDVAVEGVEIVPADAGGGSGTGHLHVFVDTDVTPQGQPIPKPDDGSIIHTTETSVTIEGLEPGEHVIWIVLGDAAHVAYEPRVVDRVTVTVE